MNTDLVYSSISVKPKKRLEKRPGGRQAMAWARMFLGVAWVMAVLAMKATASEILRSPLDQSGGFFGLSVSGIPDANGDGFGDVVVGALQEKTATSPYCAGQVYVFDGATGELLYSLDSPQGENYSYFGWRVSGLPDVDGDGLGDVLGSAKEDPGNSPLDAGRVHVFSGVDGAAIFSLYSPNEEEYGHFGASILGIEDVNGDGLGDILVGAPDESLEGGPQDAGRVYLFDGPTTALLRWFHSPSPDAFGGFGSSVASAPDLNGDGIAEILIGAPRENPGASPLDAGRVHVFDGTSTQILLTLKSPNEEDQGYFGASVSGVPDMNGDGRSDILVGAYRENPGAAPTDAGRAYVFDGATSALLLTLVSPNEQAYGYFGYSTAGIEDVNGDGRGDLLVGAFQESSGGGPAGAGRVYLFSGADGTLLKTFHSPLEQGNGYFGRSAAGVPDTNGDGKFDVVIGAFQESHPGSPSLAGRAYLFTSSFMDSTSPEVSSIARYQPLEQLTGAAQVVFQLNFTEDVANVTASNVSIDATGDQTAASMESVSGCGSVWWIAVNTAKGQGNLGLKLDSNLSWIRDMDDNRLTTPLLFKPILPDLPRFSHLHGRGAGFSHELQPG